MTTTPSWLYYSFGSLMLVVAAYCLVLLIATVAKHKPAGWDVDAAHVLMGVSMAGMFVARWAFGRGAVWEVIFAVLLTWFLARSAQSMLKYGLHLSHSLIHAVMSFAMLLMYWFPVQLTGGAPSGSMSMASSASRLDPGLALLLAFMLCASAIFTLASPNKGASHHGAHLPAYAMSGAGESGGSDGCTEGPIVSPGRVEELLALPWLEDASHVVMCVAMGFLLILMI